MSACKLVGAANTPHIRLLGAQPAAHSLTGRGSAARMAMQPCVGNEVKHGEWLVGLVYLCDRS